MWPNAACTGLITALIVALTMPVTYIAHRSFVKRYEPQLGVLPLMRADLRLGVSGTPSVSDASLAAGAVCLASSLTARGREDARRAQLLRGAAPGPIEDV